MRILKKQKMTFSKFHLFPLSFSLCVSFSASASPSHSFPLTHPLMVIYLVGKGFAFSPERSKTGREQKPSSLGRRQGGEKERAETGERNGKYIIHVGLPGDTDAPSHSSLTAVMEVKVWPQTERGEEELHVNICSH